MNISPIGYNFITIIYQIFDKITISDNEKEIKVSNINVNDYQKTKDLHGISLVDEMVNELLSTIEADK